jgi:hypothetical protein
MNSDVVKSQIYENIVHPFEIALCNASNIENYAVHFAPDVERMSSQSNISIAVKETLYEYEF